MPNIFLSYRRNDSADVTGRLHDRLKPHFGIESLFMDVDSIPVGVDFRNRLSQAVRQTDVLVAMIGDGWLTAAYDRGPKNGTRRLDDPDDYVRIEIETALALGIPVVPVLVGRATMPPPADLPDPLKELAYKNAAEVRTGSHFDDYVARLIRGLEDLVTSKQELWDALMRAGAIAERDPESAVNRASKVLERIVRNVYEARLDEPGGARSWQKLLERLIEDGYWPKELGFAAFLVSGSGPGGAGTFTDEVTPDKAQASLRELTQILRWYTEIEHPDSVGRIASNRETARKRAAADRESAADPSPLRAAVVPKGLRSFDLHDAEFFLQLLPGPRAHDELPESIRFWKYRVETASERTFTVGLVYGPSGCGKSSLVKAGLLPHLHPRITSIYVEASSDEGETEARLKSSLRKRFPQLSTDADLAQTIKALRHEIGPSKDQAASATRQKVFIVLDQFEQWLHANGGKEETELARALRQCDGEQVQVLLTVRDDFWLGITRFMDVLKIDLSQGENARLVDLFDLPHARNVLLAFGLAFKRLEGKPDAEQSRFLDQAVEGLAEEGRVVCVRLALFAEMVKDKPWTPETLKKVGGIEGVGTTFLEETFCASTADPRRRFHQEAARAVLKALLPGEGTDIKGQKRPLDELSAACGYEHRPKDFRELLRILDSELRLITPTVRLAADGGSDHSGNGDAGRSGSGREDAGVSTAPSDRFYQLTHDYLVPSLRVWIDRKQRETRRGRAGLLLASRASLWSVKPENRFLPSVREFLVIRTLTDRRSWTEPQRRMMRRARRVHLRNGGLILATLVLLAGLWLIYERGRTKLRAQELVAAVLKSDVKNVGEAIGELEGYRPWADPLLREAGRETNDEHQRLNAALALLPVDAAQMDYLSTRLLATDDAQSFLLLRERLFERRQQITGRLWDVALNVSRPADVRFRAAWALAAYTAGDDDQAPSWARLSPFVADQMVTSLVNNLDDYAPVVNLLRPVSSRLVDPLTRIFRDRSRDQAQHAMATNILKEYAVHDPRVLAGLVADADPKSFAPLFEALTLGGRRPVELLSDQLKAPREPRANIEDDASRRANTAVALVLLDKPEAAWPLLESSRPDPRMRSDIIRRLGQYGARPEHLIAEFQRRFEGALAGREPDSTILNGVLLALGGFDEGKIDESAGKTLNEKLDAIDRDCPDPGVRGAAEWLLRKWGKDPASRIKHEATGGTKAAAGRRWYVNPQGQTMVVVEGPVEFQIGSPKNEPFREFGPKGDTLERQHKVRIDHSYAIAAREVTVEEFERFSSSKEFLRICAPHHVDELRLARGPDKHADKRCAVNNVTWYQAAAYCNWLSEQEGLEPCYEPNAQGKFLSGMRPHVDFLKRSGYRLPSEAEWEFACRAGTVTSRYYGQTDELLANYAWFQANSAHLLQPVGMLMPNRLGLFDMLGNALEWCQDLYVEGGDFGNNPDASPVTDDQIRVARGEKCRSESINVRAARRDIRHTPGAPDFIVGLRPARTMTITGETAR